MESGETKRSPAGDSKKRQRASALPVDEHDALGRTTEGAIDAEKLKRLRKYIQPRHVGSHTKALKLFRQLADSGGTMNFSTRDQKLNEDAKNHFNGAVKSLVVAVSADGERLCPKIQPWENGDWRIELEEYRANRHVTVKPGAPSVAQSAPECEIRSVERVVGRDGLAQFGHYEEAVLLATLVEIDLLADKQQKEPAKIWRAWKKLTDRNHCKGYRLICTDARVIGYVGVDWLAANIEPQRDAGGDPGSESGSGFAVFKKQKRSNAKITSMRLLEGYRKSEFEPLLIAAVVEALADSVREGVFVQCLYVFPDHALDKSYFAGLAKACSGEVRAPGTGSYELRLFNEETPTHLLSNSAFAPLAEAAKRPLATSST